MKTSINLIKWICICLFFKNCNSNSFANPYVLQELFMKELQIRTHLEKANIELKSDDITKYVLTFNRLLPINILHLLWSIDPPCVPCSARNQSWNIRWLAYKIGLWTKCLLVFFGNEFFTNTSLWRLSHSCLKIWFL